MSELKYAKNIVTETKPLPKEVLEPMRAMPPPRTTVKGTRLLYIDDEVVKGAFYMECLWMHEGTSEDPVEVPHAHDFDEVIGFVGGDPKNPRDLGASIDIWMEGERHVLTSSCLVFIPKGLTHCPILFRKVDRPIIWFTLGPVSMYKRGLQPPTAAPGASPSLPPTEGPPSTKYAKYIVTEMKPGLKFPEPPFQLPPEAIKLNRFLYLDDDVIKGAFYMECVWFSEGIGSGGPEPHVHDFDEILGFMGSDPNNPRDLNGEVELWLENEKYILKNSCLVFIPKGLKHCPMIFRKAYKPIFHFSTGPGSTYTKVSPKGISTLP